MSETLPDSDVAIFLLCVVMLLISALYEWGGMRSPHDVMADRLGAKDGVALLLMAAAFSIGCAFVLHMLIGFLYGLIGHRARGDSHNAYSWLLGVGAAFAAAGFTYRLLAHRRNKALLPVRTELRRSLLVCVLGLILALYVRGVAADQFRFYGSARSFSTSADWRYTPLPWMSDVRCGGRVERVVFADIKAAEVRYRCAGKNILTFARWGDAPLLAWPFYTEGRSVTARAAIHRHFHDRNAYRQQDMSGASAQGKSRSEPGRTP